MAIAAYTTDLATVNLCTGSWAEPSGATAGRITDNDGDNFIAGTNCMTSQARTGNSQIGMHAPIASRTVAAGAAVFFWFYHGAMPTIGTFAGDGYQALIGSSGSDYKRFTVAGKDTLPKGGWFNVAVDPAASPTGTVGSPTATTSMFGSRVSQVIAVSKGNPYANDYIRHGRAFTASAGDVTTPATFTAAAAVNDLVTNKWGQFEKISGGFSQKGLFRFGSPATAVYFVDSNKSVVIEDTIHCGTGFNGFEVSNASTKVWLESVTFRSLGTQSPGYWLNTADADVDLVGCSFIGMGTIEFKPGTVATGCLYQKCGRVTPAGADLSNSVIEGYAGTVGTSAMIWDTAGNPDGKVNGMTFTKGTSAAAAIEFGTSAPTTITLTDVEFNGYNTVDGQNDSTINFLRTSGTTTLNIAGGTVPTVRTTGTHTVTVVVNPVTTTITVKDVSTGAPIEGARVYLLDPVAPTTIINALTNAAGVVADTRTWGGNTAVTGRVRKGSGGDLYKSAPISATIAAANGLDLTVQMIPDDI